VPGFYIKNPITLWARLAIVMFSFASYMVSFLITEILPDQLMYDDWIYLVFLPAGSKLIFILLFGVWGTLGDILALMIMSPIFVFEEESIWFSMAYAVVSGVATYLGVCLARYYLKISSSLGELRYQHIPLLALIGSVTHGFVTMVTLRILGNVTADEFFANYFAMILGDFIGIFVFILILRVVVKVYR
jgi:hypothetical protein